MFCSFTLSLGKHQVAFEQFDSLNTVDFSWIVQHVVIRKPVFLINIAK